MEQLYGMDIVRDAANQLRSLYGGKGKMKLKLLISVKGIKLYHFQTMVSYSSYTSEPRCIITVEPILAYQPLNVLRSMDYYSIHPCCEKH